MGMTGRIASGAGRVGGRIRDESKPDEGDLRAVPAISEARPCIDLSEEERRETLDTNVYATKVGTKVVRKLLPKKRDILIFGLIGGLAAALFLLFFTGAGHAVLAKVGITATWPKLF